MSVDVHAGLSVAASDGARLATDVVLPAGTGPWPTVLLRTYLGKDGHRAEATGWARRGFACVVQDVRGRFESEGVWRPYAHERRDGAATVDWLLDQPWCDGRVAATGASYAAHAAWSAALAHPAVRAVISMVPAMRRMPLQPEDGGILPLLSRICWWTIHAGARRPRAVELDEVLGGGALEHLPVVDLPRWLCVELPDWDELPGWADAVSATEPNAEGRDDAASDPEITDAELARLDVASLHVGGWHDPFCAETLRHVEIVGSALEPRPPRALILGPWWHEIDGGRPARFGERRYGDASRCAVGRRQASWLDAVFAGDRAATRDLTSASRVFLCGANRWVEGDGATMPPAVPSLFGDGERLAARPPSGDGVARLVYDPRRPSPCRRAPVDERDDESLDDGSREDRVVFTSAPFDGPRSIVGTPRLVLWGTTDAPSADWVARLLEVTADGRRLYLSHGLVDAERALAARGERLEPGAPHRVEIRLAPLGVVLPQGSRLRLEITGSAFPSYARNLASGEPRLTGTRTAVARQTVHWGGRRPLTLECRPRLAMIDPVHCTGAFDDPSD